MRHFVIGDIHGAFKGLKQCLERAKFDYTKDRLICLGDVCDGWPETNEAIEELLKIKHLEFILGNHDFWALQWAEDGMRSHIWLSQGGRNTINSYKGENMPPQHVELLKNAHFYYEWENKLFVHAGIYPNEPLELQNEEIFLWDRSLVKEVIQQHFNGTNQPISAYDAIYVGHTPIHNYGFLCPLKSCGVWLMDTGAGWDGVLSMMNIETEEVYTSDKINTLYPKGSGRIQ